jgi:hypothetical protein
MLKETLIVLSGIAPGVHAMRVANGAQQEKHAAFNAELGLILTRGVEMAFESVPGSVLQVATFLKTMKDENGFSKAALGSIVVSALTTGFSAATVSFE